jgi:hypothetical protein
MSTLSVQYIVGNAEGEAVSNIQTQRILEHTERIEMTNMIYSISNLMDKRIGY